MSQTLLWASHSRGEKLNDAIGKFVSEKIWGKPRGFPLSTTLGIFDNSKLIAGLVYYDYDTDAAVIQISGAATTPKWLTREVLKQMFEYPFKQLKCQAVVMRVDPGNIRLDRILTAYGFSKTVLRRLRGRDKDEALYTLFDDVWRSNKFNR